MRVTLATICLLILATAASAQSDRGTITGAIKDPTGAALARAEVIVRNIATGTEHKTAARKPVITRSHRCRPGATNCVWRLPASRSSSCSKSRFNFCKPLA